MGSSCLNSVIEGQDAGSHDPAFIFYAIVLNDFSVEYIPDELLPETVEAVGWFHRLPTLTRRMRIFSSTPPSLILATILSDSLFTPRNRRPFHFWPAFQKGFQKRRQDLLGDGGYGGRRTCVIVAAAS